MFDWQDLHFFRVLARTQSLSAAARELGVEHATVGRRIDALEAALGLRLVERLPRSRPLTEAGRALSALTERMDTLAADVERLSRLSSLDMTGVVRVSVPPSIAAHCITPHIARLIRRHPGLNLVLTPSTRLAELSKGEADIAIRTAWPDDNVALRRKLGQVRFGLYASATFRAMDPGLWTFIAYDEARDHLPQQAWLHQLRGDRRIVFAASDLASQQAAAQSGVGAVVLPTMIGERDASLVRLPVDAEGPTRDIWLAVYPDLRRSPAIKAVMDFLVECIQAEPLLQAPAATRRRTRIKPE